MEKQHYEMCTCGHFGGSTVDSKNSHAPNFQQGHGRCLDCKCTWFTWAGWCDENGKLVNTPVEC